ncbi:alpha/beta hydrolase [Candidatus Woesearchaeota archaeon]|nr:alpha/beta hydrolase [Candidatus Woesearchaeota archaeon]
MKKVQIMIIHGGMTFKSRKDYLHFLKTRKISIEEKIRWRDEYLKKKLGQKFQIITPDMPSPDNAKYIDWKIHFERHFPLLRNNIILIGISLGGIFLAKYLSENKFPKKILSTFLIAPPFDDTLPNEDLAGGFKLKSNLSLLERNSPHLTLLFSKNDDVVPVSHAKKYRRKLKSANIITFNHIKGHFKITEFPEIIELIKREVHKE